MCDAIRLREYGLGIEGQRGWTIRIIIPDQRMIPAIGLRERPKRKAGGEIVTAEVAENTVETHSFRRLLGLVDRGGNRLKIGGGLWQ
jgi:hypothetical protein